MARGGSRGGDPLATSQKVAVFSARVGGAVPSCERAPPSAFVYIEEEGGLLCPICGIIPMGCKYACHLERGKVTRLTGFVVKCRKSKL